MQRKLKSLLRKRSHKRDAEEADTKYANSPTVSGSLPAPPTRGYYELKQSGPRSVVANGINQPHGPTRSGNQAVNGKPPKEVPQPFQEGGSNSPAKSPGIAAAPKPPSPIQKRPPGATPSGALAAEEVLDLKDSEDVDVTTEWAPAVTHEHIKPITMEIRQPVIYREIHNHHVYPRIQPVLQKEILPARHFVPDPQDPEGKRLIEVRDEDVPEEWRRRDRERERQRALYGGVNERAEPVAPVAAPAAWDKEDTASGRGEPSATTTAPRVIGEKKSTTPEGFERTETTVIHPARLADMSAYTGPRETVHFYDKIEKEEDGREAEMKSRLGKGLDYVPGVVPLTLKDVTAGVATVGNAEEHHRIRSGASRARDSGIGVSGPGVHDFGHRGEKRTGLELPGAEVGPPASAPMVPSISVQPPPRTTETGMGGQDALVGAVEELNLGTDRWFPLSSAAATPS